MGGLKGITSTGRDGCIMSTCIFILQDISAAERLALQVVSYIGCGISVVCLAISIVYFLLQG